jgi:protein ImuA
MNSLPSKTDVIERLRGELLALQGLRASLDEQPADLGLGPINHAFPSAQFPTGAVHEFLSSSFEGAAATSGFMTALLGKLLQSEGPCLWISTRRTLFAPALKVFGIAPERIIFIDAAREKEALWALEQALQCDALSVVVGEIRSLGFTESRRLQLAVEQSRVTGLVHRYGGRAEGTTACVSRWHITPLPSHTDDGLPGLGFPRWGVRLSKVRNGRPNSWSVEWRKEQFRFLQPITVSHSRTVIQKTA